MNSRISLLAVSFSLLSTSALSASLSELESELDVNPMEACQDGMDLYRDGDLKGAMELIALCRDEMAQMNDQLASEAFVDQIMDFVGDPLRHQNAMGFSQIERRYRNGNQDINVTMSTGQGATMMQSLVGVAGKKTRIGKHQGYTIAQGNDNTIYVPKDGAAWQFQSRNVDARTIKKFAKEFMKGVND